MPLRLLPLLLPPLLLARGGARSSDEEPPLAHVSFGTVLGRRPSPDIDEFLGLPYAEPPVGSLRWAPPQDWRQPYADAGFNATAYGARCPQDEWSEANVHQDEDCLFLNIWVPRRAATVPASETSALPMMVFLHGGAFIHGSGNEFNGTDLALATGAIIVTLNYRLGALGFALLGGGPGNFGILDQQSALRWLRREARSFLGDASRLLLFGESAGSESTALHLLLPSSADLFSAALMESGVADTLPEAQARSCGVCFADLVNCSGEGIMDCLRQRPWPEVLAAQSALLRVPPNGSQFDVKCQFWTSVDGVIVPRQAEALMREGVFSKVPVVVGFNHDEGNLFSFQEHSNPISLAEFQSMITSLLRARGRKERPGDLDRILQAYPVEGTVDFRPLLGRAIGDFLFVCRSRRFLRFHQQSPRPPAAFKYVFSQRAAHDPTPKEWGVYHSSELPFVFGTSEGGSVAKVPELTPSEAMLSTIMRRFWVDFAVAGDPNSRNRGLVHQALPSWPRYDPTSDPHLEFNASEPWGREGAVFHSTACDAWDAVWDESTGRGGDASGSFRGEELLLV